LDEEEYNRKYAHLRILKSIQEYLKSDGDSPGAVYPIGIPDELLYQVLKLEGSESLDKLIHEIFRMGLNTWSERFYNENFGSEEDLEDFIELVKKRTRE
jgi:hypothetical protein